MRIVSLLPSATEIICSLGLQDSVVGVTHECDYPPGVQLLPHVTTTLIPADLTSGQIDAVVREQLATERALYHLNVERLAELTPDLIVTQALCDVCAVSADEVLNAAGQLPGAPPVLNLEPTTLDDVFAAIGAVGAAANRADTATAVVAALRARVDAVTARSAEISTPDRPRVAFVEWIDPLFNGGHWNPELITRAGGVDVLGAPGEPSRTITPQQFIDSHADVVVVSCCGFTAERALQDVPLLESLPGWPSLPAAQRGRIYVCDGNAHFSRPGPRLVDSLEILAHALHPDVHPAPAHPARVVSLAG